LESLGLIDTKGVQLEYLQASGGGIVELQHANVWVQSEQAVQATDLERVVDIYCVLLSQGIVDI
jgi:hypothetical protein